MKKILYLLGQLTDEDCHWLLENGRKQTALPNDCLIREGEPVDSVYILLDGMLSVRLGHTVVARLTAGEIVGELSFVDTRPPSATVEAVEASKLFAIGKHDLEHKLARDLVFAGRFYRGLAIFLADRLRTTTQSLGYGETSTMVEPDELDDNLLATVSRAGDRFLDMLDALARRSAAL
jgi:CRP-like cAMP-binding protein